MYVVATFNPTAATSGTFDMTVKQGGHIVIANESSANLILSFPNGATTYVPANDKRLYCISGQMAQPHTTITWTQQSLLPNANIVSQTVVEAYQPGENVPETYPSPLIRNTSVAGPITATTLSLIDPEWVSGPDINVITVTDPNTSLNYVVLNTHPSLHMLTNTLSPSVALWAGGTAAQSGFNTEITNQGQFIAGIQGGGFAGHIIVNAATTGSPNGDQFLVDGTTMTVPGQINANLIRAIVPNNNTGQDLGFHTEAGFNIVSTVEGTGDIFRVNAAGPQLLIGTMQLLTNGISRISGFSGAGTTTSTFFNHNLGVVPDLIALCPDGAAAATGRTIEYEHATMTSTQVKVTCGASFNFRGIAIKF